MEISTAGDADQCGKIYIGGRTNSPDSIATPGSFQPGYNGMYDCFIVKFYDCHKPDIPLNISGPANICEGATGVIYSVPSIQFATGYVWHVPPGVTFISGSATDSITVNFGAGASSGNISVFDTNCCGDGDSAILMVTIHTPPVPTLIGNDTVCLNDENTFRTDAGMTRIYLDILPEVS